MAMQVAKSGWLQRESTILRRWKRNWVVLYQDGVLKYYDHPNEVQAQDAKLMKDAMSVKTALEVTDVVLPENRSIGCLIRIDFHHSHWVFCAESVDDASAWSLALEQARVAQRPPVQVPPQLPPYGYDTVPPYTTVYQDPMYSTTTTQYVVQGPNGPNGQTTIIYPDRRYQRRRYRSRVVQGPNGQTTIVYPDENGYYPHRYYRRGYDGTDVALGAMAGVAVGSMFMGPLLFW